MSNFKIRVLVLNPRSGFMFDNAKSNEPVIECVSIDRMQGRSPSATPSFQGMQMAREAASSNHNYIVVPINGTASLEYVKNLPEEVLERTLVVWGSHDPIDVTTDYEDLGVTWFASRDDARGEVLHRALALVG